MICKAGDGACWAPRQATRTTVASPGPSREGVALMAKSWPGRNSEYETIHRINWGQKS